MIGLPVSLHTLPAMPPARQHRPMGLLRQSPLLDQWRALSDTPVHAAATALAVAGDRCRDQVRSRSVSTLFPVAADVHAGDGDDARRRSGMVVALVESASAADPSCRPLMLALERWLLHPGRDTADELTDAAGDFAAAVPEELRQRCWAVGAGLDAAVAAVAENGLDEVGDAGLAAIVAACDSGVSCVWVAHRCGVSRDALSRRLRDVRHQRPGR